MKFVSWLNIFEKNISDSGDQATIFEPLSF